MFPTADGELVLLVHLMTAGRLKYLLAGEKGPKTPALQITFEGGARLVLTEAGSKKRAGVWLLTPEAVEAELAHLGPEALGLGVDALAEICANESRRLHSLLRDQRVIAGIGRAWANEILHEAKLSPYALAPDLSREEVERLSAAIDEELSRGLELRERGVKDKQAYRVPQQARRALRCLRHADRAESTSRSTRSTTAGVPDRRARAEGPPALEAAALGERVEDAFERSLVSLVLEARRACEDVARSLVEARRKARRGERLRDLLHLADPPPTLRSRRARRALGLLGQLGDRRRHSSTSVGSTFSARARARTASSSAAVPFVHAA
jgi:ribosomal protein S13